MNAVYFVLMLVYWLWVFDTARSCSRDPIRFIAVAICLVAVTGVLSNLWQVIALFVLIVSFFTKLVHTSKNRTWVMGAFLSCCCMLAGIGYGLYQIDYDRHCSPSYMFPPI